MVSTCCLLATAAAAAEQKTTEPVFHAGTRLVEVNVVVRQRPVRPPGFTASLRYWFDIGPPYGPPGATVTGLTKNDFTVFDNGKPQPIAVFNVGNSTDVESPALPPGVFSNRADNAGETLNGATAVLVDLLNTPFDLSDYARTALKEILRSGPTNSRVALFTLGENLHTLRDFSDETRPPVELTRALRDFGDIMGLEDVHGRITYLALKRIIQHLSGLPGRRSLVWLSQLAYLPPGIANMLQRANIVLYPVMVRCMPGGAPCGFASMEDERANRETSGSSGGRGFYDAKDLTFALRTATEDSTSAYTLGYYPSEEMLDGKFHRITVRLNRPDFEVHYRSGYLATKVASPPQPQTMADLFGNPLNASGIGLTAEATPERDHPGLYDLRVTVDLRDIRLGHAEGHSTGSIYFSVPDPVVKGNARTTDVPVDLTDEQLARELDTGFRLLDQGVAADSGEIRIVVRDRATGAAGSLRIPVAQQ